MLTGLKIIHDHSAQGDDTKKTDDPQSHECITQVMSARTGPGDAADQPCEEGDHRYDQEQEEPGPGQEVLPEPFQDKILHMEYPISAEDQRCERHDQREGDTACDEEKKGFEQYPYGMPEAIAGLPDGRSRFRCPVLGALFHFLTHLLKTLAHFGAHFFGPALEAFEIAFDGILNGLQIHFFTAHLELLRGRIGLGKHYP